MLHGIQALRGYAALLVAAFHLHAASLNEGNQASLWHIFSTGGLGVDLFFAISGFVIIYSAKQSHVWSSQIFIVKRIFRIFPLYWFALLSSILLGISLYILTGDASRIAGISKILSNAFLLPTSDYIMVVSWTLTIELIYYIIVALSFKKNRVDILIGAVIIWSCASLIITIALNERGWLEFVFHPAVPALAFGSIIAAKFSHLSKKTAYFLIIGGVIAMLPNFVFELNTTYSEYRAIIAGIPCALIVCGAANIKFKFNMIHNFIGDISYAIYLFHIPTYLVCGFVIQYITGMNPYHFDGYMLIMLFSAVFISTIAHYWIDLPIQRCVKYRMGTKRAG